VSQKGAEIHTTNGTIECCQGWETDSRR